MKKMILWIAVAAVLLLLNACGTETPVVTPEPPTLTVTLFPDVTAEPVETPTPSAAPSPTKAPAPTAAPVPGVTAEPVETPAPSITPSATEAPTMSPTLVPDITAEPTETPVPSVTPTSTEASTPTATLVPTEAPIPTLPPTATPVPTPTIDPGPLVLNGWQKTEDITGSYAIVFPEVFDNSDITREERELRVEYTSTENDAIAFYISYAMKQTLEEVTDAILTEGGIILEQRPQESRADYLIQDETTMYQGVVLEDQYTKELLGPVFGEEELVTGTLQVIFAFPKDKTEYTAEQYRFYVVPLP